MMKCRKCETDLKLVETKDLCGYFMEWTVHCPRCQERWMVVMNTNTDEMEYI